MSEHGGIIADLKRAATWRWNLLGLGAGLAFALLSPATLPVLAIVGAAELAYLGFLGLNPRFQRALRLEAGAKSTTGPDRGAALARFRQMLGFLREDDRARFEALRRRCAELFQLRQTMEAKDGATMFGGEALDQMLWLFLRLLHQKAGLDRFLETTDQERIEADLDRAEDQLKDALARDGEGPESRLAATIRDRANTIRDRLDNFRKARDNHELICAEIDKTEQQIKQLCETGMTLRDTSDLTAQINTVSSTLQISERVFAETSFGSGLEDTTLVPPLLTSLPASPPPIPKRVSQ